MFPLNSFIKRLRFIAICEGISYLLFGITMPLKYMMDMPEPNYIVGAAHGFLFLTYMAIVTYAIYKYKWNWKISLLVWAAAFIPFGTFYADAKVFKKEMH